MSIEIWKDIKGYEGKYQVSNLGRVKSLPRYTGHGMRKMRILKYGFNGGYRQVVLCKNGKMKSQKIHRLVACAFLPNKDDTLVVNHKDGNKENNHVENLEWCTRQENVIHSFKMGLSKVRYGKENKKSIPIYQYTLDGKFIKEWSNSREVTRETKMDYRNINSCCRGKIKTAYGFIWKYAERSDDLSHNKLLQ